MKKQKVTSMLRHSSGYNCCKLYNAPEFGCKPTPVRKYKRKQKIRKPSKHKEYTKRRYKNRNPRRKNYIKYKRYKKLPTNPKRCQCYECGEMGHRAFECKNRKTKNLPIRKINNIEFIPLEIIEIEKIKLDEQEYIYEIEEEISEYSE